MTSAQLALGLTGPQLIGLIGDSELIARWDALPVALTVLGVDRVDGSVPADSTLDASVAGALLASRTGYARFLVASAPGRDHPYNLARRVASLGHLSRGRSGLILGDRDAYVPSGAPWLAAEDVDPRTVTTDVARAVRALEQSWPFDSVVAERESRIFVHSDRIRRVDIGGTFQIAGPLTVPEPASGASVIARYAEPAETGEELDEDAVFDLVLGSATVPRMMSAPELPVQSLLAEAEWLIAKSYHDEAGPGTLRAVLGLPEPAAPVSGAPAFDTGVSAT